MEPHSRRIHPQTTSPQRPKTAAGAESAIMDTSVWASLGSPDLQCMVPGPRTWGWQEARRQLEQACRRVGGQCRIRTPGVLWSLLHAPRQGGGVPRGLTWERLCGEATVWQLLQRVQLEQRGYGLRVATWNVRWLVSPHTMQGILKRQHIQRGLGQGKLIALQEMRWGNDGADIWG